LILNLSKGFWQRVGIALDLVGDPRIIILDEPTVGLDPQQIIEIRELIKALGEERTVILSSHILSEVQAICNTILIISKGKLVACDTAENLERHFTETTTVELTVEASEAKASKALRAVRGVSSLLFLGEDGGRSMFEITSSEDESVCRDIFFAFSDIGKPILRMTTTRASLEDVFIELTKDEANEAGGASDADEADEPGDADGANAAENAEIGERPNFAHAREKKEEVSES
jgi:ABC-2 type transport system ATP-binding protein